MALTRKPRVGETLYRENGEEYGVVTGFGKTSGLCWVRKPGRGADVFIWEFHDGTLNKLMCHEEQNDG